MREGTTESFQNFPGRKRECRWEGGLTVPSAYDSVGMRRVGESGAKRGEAVLGPGRGYRDSCHIHVHSPALHPRPGRPSKLAALAARRVAADVDRSSGDRAEAHDPLRGDRGARDAAHGGAGCGRAEIARSSPESASNAPIIQSTGLACGMATRWERKGSVWRTKERTRRPRAGRGARSRTGADRRPESGTRKGVLVFMGGRDCGQTPGTTPPGGRPGIERQKRRSAEAPRRK